MRKIENMKWWPEALRQRETLSLRQLSEIYGVSPSDLSAALRRAGRAPLEFLPADEEDLPPEPGESKASPTEALPAPTRRQTSPRTVPTLAAWRLLYRADVHERVILAASVEDAARAAARFGADVVGLAFLGEVVQSPEGSAITN
jgi:hypothetical protein